jgi:hypothetical protein
MKREYQAPATEVLEYMTEGMTCASGVSSNNGLEYGGIDENGTMNAETRTLFNDFLFE